MKRLLSLIIGLFRKNKRNATSYTAKCKHVFDGDSFSALKDGDTERNTLTEFNSHNTELLDVEQVKEKLLSLQYIRDELAAWEAK